MLVVLLLQLDKMVSHVNEILPVTFMGEDEYEDESEDDEVSQHRHDVAGQRKPADAGHWFGVCATRRIFELLVAMSCLRLATDSCSAYVL